MALSGSPSMLFVRQEIAPTTGSTSALVPPNDYLLFTNAATTAAQTITLPASPGDGQMVPISNFSQITSLTFSPAVSGWTNTSTLAAGQGILLMYSATLATPGWFVVAS